jgi:hypothetical protein
MQGFESAFLCVKNFVKKWEFKINMEYFVTIFFLISEKKSKKSTHLESDFSLVPFFKLG